MALAAGKGLIKGIGWIGMGPMKAIIEDILFDTIGTRMVSIRTHCGIKDMDSTIQTTNGLSKDFPF